MAIPGLPQVEDLRREVRSRIARRETFAVVMSDFDRLRQAFSKLRFDGLTPVIQEWARVLAEEIPGGQVFEVRFDNLAVVAPAASVEETLDLAEKVRRAVPEKLVPRIRDRFPQLAGLTVSVGAGLVKGEELADAPDNLQASAALVPIIRGLIEAKLRGRDRTELAGVGKIRPAFLS